MNSAWSSLLWFALIVVAIPAVLLLVKHSPLGRLHGFKAQAGDCPMRSLSTLALSPSQKVVTVEVGQGAQRRWLVLGVTPGSITALHQIDPADGLHGTGQGDPAWQQPQRHTRDLDVDGDAVAIRPPGIGPSPAAESTRPTPAVTSPSPGEGAAILPFGQLLARLRGRSADPHHG
jgi:flagellar protein FliO/FliZ